MNISTESPVRNNSKKLFTGSEKTVIYTEELHILLFFLLPVTDVFLGSATLLWQSNWHSGSRIRTFNSANIKTHHL